MADENNRIEESTAPTGKIWKGILILIAVALVGILITYLIAGDEIQSIIGPKADNNDIDGYWNSTLTEHTYVFIPKCNINDLVFTFSIRDKNNKELQTIVKKIGNVKKGQQYTISFNMLELKDFATLMDANYTKLSVTGGTRKLI